MMNMCGEGPVEGVNFATLKVTLLEKRSNFVVLFTQFVASSNSFEKKKAFYVRLHASCAHTHTHIRKGVAWNSFRHPSSPLINVREHQPAFVYFYVGDSQNRRARDKRTKIKMEFTFDIAAA